ncbi:MAG: hypothetical protein ACTHJ0_00285 [Flavipsychrobacter sp.]
MSTTKKPPLLAGLFLFRCPTCRKGHVFVNRSVFPLKDCQRMVDKCPVCGQKMKFESNNGGGINYALTVMLFFLNLLWYWPIFGISYKDNSIFYYLATSIVVVLLAQPWLMRFSRIVYLYLFVKFGSVSEEYEKF